MALTQVVSLACFQLETFINDINSSTAVVSDVDYNKRFAIP